jgi:hypothetical protein
LGAGGGRAVLIRDGGCLNFGQGVERDGTGCGSGCDRSVSAVDRVF